MKTFVQSFYAMIWRRVVWTLCASIAALGCAASAQEITYQGQLLVAGSPFTGTAQVKFAIVKGSVTIWSNDGSSSAGSQPSLFVNLPVKSGVFSAMLGASPMQPITGAGASDLGDAVLRLWVSTNGGAFTQLSDQTLASVPTALGLRQVDPAATGYVARWDGKKLSSGLIQVNNDGHVSIGPSPALSDVTLAVLSNDLATYGANIQKASPKIASNSSNAYFGARVEVTTAIGAGILDSGYRTGLNVQAIGSGIDFAGTLSEQRGLWTQVGTAPGSTGAIGTSYAALLQTLAGGGPIANSFGIYQYSETANTRNYFQSKVGIGTTSPGSPLTVAGVIESTSGGIKFPDGTVQTTADEAGIRTVNGSTGPGVTIQGSGGIIVSTSGNSITVSSAISSATCVYGPKTYSPGAACYLAGLCYNYWTNSNRDCDGCGCRDSTGSLCASSSPSRVTVLVCQPDGTWRQSDTQCLNNYPPGCGK